MIWLSLAALFSGALLPIAFSPLNIYGAAFILPAVLLYIWLQLSAKNAFWTGWLFGLGFFGTGTSWIYISIHQYGNASVPLAAVITFIFCAFLALFFGLFGYIFRKFFARYSDAKQCLLVFPALWLVFEYLRSTLLTGFSFILL